MVELEQMPELHALTQLRDPPNSAVPEVVVMLPTVASYDELIEVAL